MRAGQNPAKALRQVAHPAEITAAVTTYIPFTSGYYEQSLEVLKLSLESLRAHADLPFDLMVFDNASCERVREFLMEEHHHGRIQYLILSEQNMGVVGAWNVLFGAAPGKYIAYSDYDIFFYPNWLSPLVKVLETFPQAGMVTGMPLLTPEQYSDKTVAWAEGTKEANLESDQGISWEDTWRHGGSIGSSEQETREFFEKTTRFQVRYQGLQCYIGAGHFQFIGRKSIFQEIIPLYAERPMGGEVRNLDIAINSHGYLRLNTPEWHVEHMGNTMVERFINQIMDHPGGTEKEIEIQKKEHWVTRIPIIRRLLKSMYRRIFKVLYR